MDPSVPDVAMIVNFGIGLENGTKYISTAVARDLQLLLVAIPVVIPVVIL